jgi:arylsulfatase A-like enzyme
MEAMTPQQTTPPPADSKKGEIQIFWIVFWMAVALVGTKLHHIRTPGEWSWNEINRYVIDIGIVVAADLLFAAVVGLVGWGLVWLLRNRPRGVKIARAAVMAYAVLAVLYAVVSARLFEYLRTPLSYTLIYLMGDMGNMRSSIATYVTVPLVTALVLTPIGFVVLVMLSRRYVPLKPSLAVRIAQGVTIVAIVGLFLFSRQQVARAWGARHEDRRIADNPHYVLYASCIRELFGGQSVILSEPYTDEDLNDFRTVAERPAPENLPTPGLKRGPKNVILIVAESVGTQFLSLYGSKYKTWPKLEAEAKYSVVFDNYYSHITNTANSHVNLALATYTPLDWRQYTIERPDYPGTTVAQVLKPLGYRTAFISAGHNAWSNQANFLKNRGYDVVQDAADTGCPEFFSWGVEDKCMIDGVLKFIDTDPARKQPFFVFSWTQGTHHPYGPEYGTPAVGWDNPDLLSDPKTYGNMSWDLGRYMCALYELDKQIARLLNSLRERGLADDTIVIITGDHGEAFGYPHESYGHSGKVHQEDVHVPLMIWSPALFSGGSRSKTIGGHVDLSPTILDLLNQPLPATWQGRSLFSPHHPQRAYFYGAMDNYYFGLREGRLKYIYNATLGRDAMYDLETDPLEQRNISEQRPQEGKRMRARLAAWLAYQKKATKR